MVEKSAWRRLERRLLPIVYVAILVLFCSSIAFLPTHIDYNPDEARIVNAVRDLGTGWFQEPSWVPRTHLLAQVDFYLLAHVVTVTVGVLKLVGAFFMILSFIYLAWLSYAYSLFSRLSLLVLLLLLSTNGPVYLYGGWGAFDYAQRILMSVLLLHALLFLHKTRLHAPRYTLVSLLLGFCLATAGYAANVLPIVLLVLTAYCCWPLDNHDNVPSSPRPARVNALILIVPTVSVGLFTLAYFSHAELGNPRNEILWMYFSTSGYPQSASGLLGFLGAMTGSFLFSTFLVWPPDHPIVSLVVAGAFGIGLTRSLLERRRDSRRFSIGVYVLLVLVCLAGLSATGLYAFGDIRYALFIHGPLLVVAAYGITDVGRWMWVVGSRTARRFVAPPVVDGARGVGVIALIVLTLVASLATATRVRSIKSDYDREFGTAVQLIKTDRSPLVIYDEYAQINLDAIGIDFPNKRPFFFDAPFLAGRPDVSLTDFDEYRAFLRTGQDILWITYHTPDSAPQFADLIFPGESGQVDYAAHVTFRTCRLSNALGLRYPSDECSRYGL